MKKSVRERLEHFQNFTELKRVEIMEGWSIEFIQENFYESMEGSI
jgi:hypothetical protein